MRATTMNSSGQRVVSTIWLLPSTPVKNPISGKRTPKATKPVKPASRNAPVISTRPLCASACLTTACISDLLDIRPAEQALRQEDQGDGEHGEGGDVLVVDGEVSRPEGLDQADQDAAAPRAGQRADAAEHGCGKRFHARHKAVGKGHDTIVPQVHGAGDGGPRG